MRTDFSLGESAIASEDVAAIAKRLGQTDVAVADTMNVSGLIDISRKAQKDGVELHMGVRLRIVDNADARNKDDNKTAWYPKVFARTEEGMRSIFRLLTRATETDRFYFVPRLSLDDLLTLDPLNVVITTGDTAGLFTRPDRQALFDKLRVHFGDSFFVELVAVPSPYFERVNLYAYDTMVGATFGGIIVTVPTLYDDGAYDALFLNMAIQNRSILRKGFTVSDPWFKGFQPRTPAELVQLVKDTIEGMRVSNPSASASAFSNGLREGNQRFFDMTPYRWKKEALALPKLVDDAPKAVLEACKEGVRARLRSEVFGYKPTPAQISEDYIPRLKYELDVLTRLEFCDYFLVVADLVNWAKGAGIAVGPGRGSVGGSLIAYLMGITDIDPIRFGLIFERFINPSRNDLPDADLDFMSTRREEVIRYLEGKYGADKVAGITNFGVLGSASALRDVARVHGQDMSDFTPSKFIPSIHGQPVDLETARSEVAEIQKFADSFPVIWKGALAMQNVMRSFGRHAAGTIVSGVPIVERGVVERDGDGRKVNWDMRVCEDMGLVKLDVLGLSTLDTLSRCVRFVKERHARTVDLLSIPLDDPITLKAFSEGQTVGVFQWEGGAARRILKDMAATSDVTFDDIVAANALNRPGPIDAGLVQQYIEGRNGSPRSLAHPNMKGALEDTYNVIVYQEQVMRVAVDLCGFTLTDADKLRKAMGKKDPVLMKSFREQFVSGADTHSGMDAKAAEALFDQIEVFAGYAFNKSHAAEYSLISYQCMWLKCNYAVEFYAAALSTVKEDKLQVLVNDASIHGISVLPPDINISTDEFVIGNDTTLYIPFNRIKGVSDKGARAIMVARASATAAVKQDVDVPTGEFFKTGPRKGEAKTTKETREITIPVTAGKFISLDDFLTRVNKTLVNVRVQASLDTVGAFSRLVPGQKPALDVSRRREQMVLLPGLMTGVITADRVIDTKDKFTMARIGALVREYREIKNTTKIGGKSFETEIFHAQPGIGSKARFMAVSDGPSRSEEQLRMFTKGSDFAHTAEALLRSGLTAAHGYWTGLIKRRKTGKSLSPDEIKTYQPFLEQEIEVLKPPLIITLGSAAARYFVPELKGDIMEHVGRTFWSEKLDAMILIGFNPAMCHFDPGKIEVLTEVFETARSIVLPDE